MPYLNITENGAGRIHFSKTPKNIAGLSITGLQTCTGIVILGDQGISVLHDESYLSIDSIEYEFKFVGTVKQWAIFYNPVILKGNELTSRQEEMAPIINKYKKQYISGAESDAFCMTSTGKLAIARTAKNISAVKTGQELPIATEPTDAYLRKAIRHLNNLCAYLLNEKNKTTHRIVPVDLQFDSMKQTNPPQLILKPKQVDEMVRKAVSWWSSKERSEYLSYCVIACGQQAPSSGLFKSALTKFDQLEKSYLENNDPKLLLKLVKLAAKAKEECIDRSHDYESAEHYDEKFQTYLFIALDSDDKTIKRLAQEMCSSSDEAKYNETLSI